MTRRKFKIGDYIVFKCATRWSCAKAKRKIVEIDNLGHPLVRYGGWSHFIVHPKEILEVIR